MSKSTSIARASFSAALVATLLTLPTALSSGQSDPVPPSASAGETTDLALVATRYQRRAYQRAVLRDRPTAFLRNKRDQVTGQRGTITGSTGVTRLPNGARARTFNGTGAYMSFANRSAFSVPTTGVITVEYWMRPSRLQFTHEEGSGYVYVLGKGRPGGHEWYGRMYSRDNSENRPNRISGYAFNPEGGLGAGSYFQDPVKRGRWIHVALVINSNARSSAYPTGYTKIYKNGVLRDTDSLAGYNIRPEASSAPLRIGTGYLGSYFAGAVGHVAFYNRELPARRVAVHNRVMRRSLS
ncbi:MAG: LamG-like jellyroll fold domain-containing protein [Nocardioides sp.]|nr:LamG-like jellyroll fold domain-containing protein [Nocardioides sp.]